MSWLGALAGKAEDFLNKIDNTAASALQHNEGHPGYRPPTSRPTPPSEFQWGQNRKLNGPSTPSDGYSPFLSVSKTNAMTTSTSVPSNLNKMNGDSTQSNGPSPSGAMSHSMHSTGQVSPTTAKKKDKDEALFEFLNSGDVKVDTTKKTKLQAPPPGNGGKHSRASSGASTPTRTPVEGPPPSMSMAHADHSSHPANKQGEILWKCSCPLLSWVTGAVRILDHSVGFPPSACPAFQNFSNTVWQ